MVRFIGALHPAFAKANDLDEVYVAEIKLGLIYDKKQTEFKFSPISKVPSVERDIAML